MKVIPLVVFLAVALQTWAQHSLDQGLVACYSFSGNANDGSGNNNNGTVQGAVLTGDRLGRPDSAYHFNGMEDYIRIPSAPIVINRNFTFALWAYIDVMPNRYESSTLFSIGFGEDNYHYGISLSNYYGPIGLTGWTVGGFNQVGASIASTRVLPAVNTWYHIVMTQTDDSLTMYVNGERARATVAGIPYFYLKDSSIINIGLRSNGREGFAGKEDDVSIYSRALFADEVRLLYTKGLPCAVIPTPVINNLQLCGGGMATLSAAGGEHFLWYDAPSDGNLLFDGNPFITPFLTDTAIYYVANVVNHIESARVKVMVTVSPVPSIECHFPQKININTEQQFPVTASAGTPPYSYFFDFGDQTRFNTKDPDPMHVYKLEGLYSVSTILTDARGCVAECTMDVDVKGELFIPNVITVNPDTLNQVFAVFYRENDQYYRYSGDNPYSMFIYNRWGELVYSTRDVNAGWTGEDSPTGVYFYRILLGFEEYKGWVDVLK